MSEEVSRGVWMELVDSTSLRSGEMRRKQTRWVTATLKEYDEIKKVI